MAHKLRRIGISVLLDTGPPPSYLFLSKWRAQQEVRRCINFASRKFRQEFQIEFYKAELIDWDLGSASSVLDAVTALHQLFNKRRGCRGEIVAGFTSRNIFDVRKGISNHGLTMMNSAVTLIKLNLYCRLSLLHELGHIFGAKHTKETSVMQECDAESMEFDEENRGIILQNRARKFG